MKNFKSLLFTLLACLILSCSTDSIISEDENTTVSESSLADVDLLGIWTGIDVIYSGTTTITNSNGTTTQDIQSSNFNGDYTITFLENPAIVTGEGHYSIDEEIIEIDGNNTIRTINNLNLINSLTDWTLVDDQLTIDSNGKITIATIEELTTESLILVITENNTSTINGTTTIENKNATFVFTRY